MAELFYWERQHIRPRLMLDAGNHSMTFSSFVVDSLISSLIMSAALYRHTFAAWPPHLLQYHRGLHDMDCLRNICLPVSDVAMLQLHSDIPMFVHV